MTLHFSHEEFAERFDHPADVAGYLDHCGQKITRRFDQASYIALSRSIDQYRGHPELIRTPLTLVAFDTDLLAPPALVAELAEAAQGPVQQHTITSTFGHDAFLKETAAVGRVLTAALEEQIHVVQ